MRKMEEVNPLETNIVTLPQKNIENKRGRPLAAKVVKYSPQPKSIISQLLRRSRKKNCDVQKTRLQNIHNISDSNFEIENDTHTHTHSLENDPVDHDSFKVTYLIDDRECNKHQNSNTLRDKKDESESKSCEIACYVCSYRSSSHREHRIHLTSHRNQPYTCNFPNCKYTCKLSCNLIKHKRIHTSEKPYLCDQCTFRSNFANSLKVHKRIHTSERPYCCQHCSYRCNSSSNLKKHCQHKHRNVS